MARATVYTLLAAAANFLFTSATASAAPPDPAGLAAKIDARIAARWQAGKVEPAAPADDATFARRVYLDLVGRIPTVAEARAFSSDKAADKRAKLVAALLDSPAHARHTATFWRREWVPQTDTPQFAVLADDIEDWLAARVRGNAPYDRMARDLLTAPRVQPAKGVPTTFLVASEFKPESLAANTARAFLGVNLDCAQCHDHPFARWTRDQFWQTAAFFARPPADRLEAATFEIAVGDTKRTVAARLLTDRDPAWPAAPTPDAGRAVLADWVTAADNPYFARNAVNRVWANLFGVGLVEPLDDLSGENPASHPELLDELAKAFADSGFDLKYLTAAVVGTKAYQLSSVVPQGGSTDPRLFAAAAVRGLTGEQLHDSLRVAAGLPAERADLDPIDARRGREGFAAKFRTERGGHARRSILQSLALMNGPLTGDLTDPAKSPTLRAVADAPFLDASGKVGALYLAALGRKPTGEELGPLVAYVEKGSAGGGATKPLADVFWVLLNGSEFSTNH
ncbi:MAG: DUF1549 and DUF1553 domain-containing protein [Gemmataceae bacterium]|nr:DUF1549 and DUF1553 domain-containing protein [Gemmataceae bacterium]